ncbi:GNAT family N-acetyltransferase [Methylosinus sp. RM1]|uniref:GNAT family N-acetyltransferase n=1 Tax=Methylosinus sp. RM1 TaxID=2583817 RepID=UPI00140CC242
MTLIFAPITTPRLFLRPLRRCDLSAVFRILSCPITTKDVSWRQHGLEDTERWLQRRIEDEARYCFCMLAMELDNREVVGLCGFFIGTDESLELGYVVHYLYQSQGLASEAASAVMMVAKDAGRSVFATIRRNNYASIKVCEKVGLRRTHEVVPKRPELLMFRWPPPGGSSK